MGDISAKARPRSTYTKPSARRRACCFKLAIVRPKTETYRKSGDEANFHTDWEAVTPVCMMSLLFLLFPIFFWFNIFLSSLFSCGRGFNGF